MVNGVSVKVCQHLIGAKKAIKLNGVLFVSPAMWYLCKTATERELIQLLLSIDVLDLDVKRTEISNVP